MAALSAPELVALMEQHFPQAPVGQVEFERVEHGSIRFRYRATELDLRPGNTVSGPTLMAISDLAVYFAVLAALGPVLLAVTTSLHINFLRKPAQGELTVEAKLLKLGKRLAVGEVAVYGAGSAEPVSHATVTYAIPQR